MIISDTTVFDVANLMLCVPYAHIKEHHDQIREWIRQGGNPNAMRDEVSLMAHLWRGHRAEQDNIQARGLRQTARLALIKDLLIRGADPWMGTPSFFDIDTKQSGIGPQFLLGIFSEHEKEGTKVRSTCGNNALHAVMRHAELELSRFMIGLETTFLCGGWLNERNALGNTPLMTLWGERSKAEMDDFQLVRAFGITLDLMVAGCDLTQVNHEGQCAASMMQSHEGIHNFLDRLPNNVDHTKDYRLASQIASERAYLLEQIRIATEHHALTQATQVRPMAVKNSRF